MKTLISLILLLVIRIDSSYSQIVDTINIYQYDSSLPIVTPNGFVSIKANEDMFFLKEPIQFKDSLLKNFNKVYYVKCFHKTNDYLIYEALQNGFCAQGPFKEYYPNGNIKRQGNFITFSNPKNINDSCNRFDGKWEFFNQSGQLIRTEYWDKGTFLYEEPFRTYPGPWKMEVYINGKMIPPRTIGRKYIKTINVKIYPKNNLPVDSNVVLTFIIRPRYTRADKVYISLPYYQFNQYDFKTLIRKYYKPEGTIEISLDILKGSMKYTTLYNVQLK
jgi:hypothetical protein